MQRFECDSFRQTTDFEHHTARFHNCDPIFYITFTFTHTGFRSAVSIRFIREDSNPYLPAALHFTRQCTAGSFDLASGNPAGFHSHQAIIAEGNFRTAQSFTAHAAALLLTILHTFWH